MAELVRTKHPTIYALVTAGCSTWVEPRPVAMSGEGSTWPKDTRVQRLALEGLDPESEQYFRWSLSLLQLYFLADQDYFTDSNASQRALHALRNAAPQDQTEWVKLYLEAPGPLSFAESTIRALVSKAPELQNLIMDHLSMASGSFELGFIRTTIPHATRLKRTRRSYLLSKKVHRSLWYAKTAHDPARHMSPLFSADLERIVANYWASLQDQLKYDPQSDEWRIPLLESHRFGMFGFIHSTAMLFRVPSDVSFGEMVTFLLTQLPKNRCGLLDMDLILSCFTEAEKIEPAYSTAFACGSLHAPPSLEYVSRPLELSDLGHAEIGTRLNLASVSSRLVLGNLLTWPEIRRLHRKGPVNRCGQL